MKTESNIRDDIVRFATSMFNRGLTFGASGNISVRLEDGWLMTPTGSTLGNLDPARLSKLDNKGQHVSGDRQTRESFLHMAMYEERPVSQAIVHLHSTYSVAVSCCAGVDPKNVLPPITAYYAMKIGTLPLVPYFPPGSLALAAAVRELAPAHHAVLLANHGPVVAGNSLADAVYATEELEQTAHLYLLLRQGETRYLTPEQVTKLQKS